MVGVLLRVDVVVSEVGYDKCRCRCRCSFFFFLLSVFLKNLESFFLNLES